MFANSYERKELLIVFQTYKELLRQNCDLKSDYLKDLIENLRHRILILLDKAEIIETTEIQLRFGQLDYDLISKLQTDPLVDPICTPKTKASIKISLGTIQKLKLGRIGCARGDRVRVHTTQHTPIF